MRPPRKRIASARSGGLGASLQTKILQNLAIAKSGEAQLRLHKAAALLEHAVENVKQGHPEYSRVEIAGDFRTGCELISDLAIFAQGKAPAEPGASSLKLTVSDKKHYGATLKLVASASEENIHETLGLPFIEPELREGRDEIKLAAKYKLPELVRDGDLRGFLHSHTDASDGTETLVTMAEATQKRGFEYYGVADHSQLAHYAGGLSLDEIGAQHREADRLNRRYGSSFRILKGIESDILADGSLDYPDAILEEFDFVVASVHSRFKMTRKEQTDRHLKAIGNPHTTIIGHMTGRQLQRRPGYEIDIDKVLKACKERGRRRDQRASVAARS